MFGHFGPARGDRSPQRIEIFHAGAAAGLCFLEPLVNDRVGVFPRNGDHLQAVLILDLLCHPPQFFPRDQRARYALQALAIIYHRLKRLQSMAGLRPGDPDQAASSPVHRRHVSFDLGAAAEKRRRGRRRPLARQGDASLRQLEERSPDLLREVPVGAFPRERAERCGGTSIGDLPEQEDGGERGRPGAAGEFTQARYQGRVRILDRDPEPLELHETRFDLLVV
jgi:hypothetical protein